MPKISIIVPIYNAIDDVKVLCESLNKKLDFNISEVFLINDFSNTETTYFLRNFCNKYKQYKYIENDKNLGFVKTCNKGMELSTGDIVILLNSDTEIPSGFCKRIIECFASDSKIGIASPIASFSATYFISLPKTISLETMNKLLIEKHTNTYPLIAASEGFCFCIRREVIENQGYFDTVWGKGYCEEVDYAYRAITNGWKNVLIDNLYVYHKRQASFGSERRKKLMEQNSPIFKRRWAGFRENYEQENNLVNPVIEIEKELFPKGNPAKSRLSFTNIERIFSIKNSFDKSHKLITICGIKFKFKRRKNKKKNYKIIYTCITGNYDYLIQHTYVNPTYDYICFTDNKKLLKSKKIGIWNIKPLKFNKLDNIRNARWHKTHPHILFPQYIQSIWCDGNIDILTNKFFNNIYEKNMDIVTPLHDARQCVYDECNAVVVYNKTTPEEAEKAKEFLESVKMPQNYGLNETNIIYRKHNNSKIINMMDNWWECIENISYRDQLSFSYILWKNNFSPVEISIANNKQKAIDYKIIPHKKSHFKIFSVKDEINGNKLHKVIIILGIKFSIKMETRKSSTE